jgi:tripartite-type tricarboxylate transporter receptor subunit TctC
MRTPGFSLAIFFAAAFGLTPGVGAQDAYPSRPVRIIVAFPAGQATDLAARSIAQKLTENLGQQFVVDNRPGAASIIGSELAARSPNNGYTLFMGSSGSLAVNPGMYSKLPYDPVRDFTPISQALYVPFFIFVHPGVPAHNVKELVDHLKTNPNKINFGSAGPGASNHLSAEFFKSTAGVAMMHVPYKGSPPAVTDLLAGQINLMFETGPLGLPHTRTGKLKVIAVGSRQRSAAMPDLATIAESGYPGFETVGWAGLLAPAGAPKPIIARLNSEVARAVAQPGANDRFVPLGAELVSSSPDVFGAYIKSEIIKWGKVIKESGARAD